MHPYIQQKLTEWKGKTLTNNDHFQKELEQTLKEVMLYTLERVREEMKKMTRGACCDCRPEEGYKCYHVGKEEIITDVLKLIDEIK